MVIYINKLIVQSLSSLGIDIAWQEYSGNSDEYIVFSIYNDKESDFYDDENTTETYYIAINYWYKSKKNIHKWKEIKELMKSYGFTYDNGMDLKENLLYGKNMDFIYVKEVK